MLESINVVEEPAFQQYSSPQTTTAGIVPAGLARLMGNGTVRVEALPNCRPASWIPRIRHYAAGSNWTTHRRPHVCRSGQLEQC